VGEFWGQKGGGMEEVGRNVAHGTFARVCCSLHRTSTIKLVTRQYALLDCLIMHS
jgi:hypothetical protein